MTEREWWRGKEAGGRGGTERTGDGGSQKGILKGSQENVFLLLITDVMQLFCFYYPV